jgi:NADP-dependent 3-hydroxy acid dehydrogenase YdfG
MAHDAETKTIVVVGFGPGVSSAVADRFGAEGFSVALVGRSAERLAAGVAALEAKGVTAVAITADAGDPATVRAAIQEARARLGSVRVIHWNAYGGAEAGDLLTTDAAAARDLFDIAIVGLLAAVQEALPDLAGTNEGAVLITNGAFGEATPGMDRYAVSQKAMGLALANAAKDKLAGLLAARLQAQKVYVGEVIIAGMVKGTPWASGAGGIEPASVAERFWELYQARGDLRARVS